MSQHEPFLDSNMFSLLNKHKFVVVGADHRNPLNIIRSLGMCGISCDAIVIGQSSHLIASSRYIGNLFLVPSYDAAIHKLLELYSSLPERTFILTGEDKMTELLNKRKNLLHNFFFFSMQGEKSPNFYFEKQNQNALALKCGFQIPKSLVWHRGDSLDVLNNLAFPVITKATDSLYADWKDITKICLSHQELTDVLQNSTCDEILIQQYIDKKNELAIQGYSSHDGTSVDYTISTSYKYLLDGNYSHYVEASVKIAPLLKDKINCILEKMGFNGIFEIEFLVDKNDSLWFLEINPRCTALLYLSNWVNLPPAVLWALQTLESPIQPQPYTQKTFYGISEFDDFRARVLTKKISLGHWLKDLKNCQCYCYYNKSDKKPFFSELNTILIRKMKK